MIGTHGLSGVKKLFFGSTTEHVLQRVTIPVLAIPPSTRMRKPLRKGTRAQTVARVVAPIDLAGQWEPDARGAADIARWFDAELVLVHVVPRIQMPPWLGRNMATNDRRRAAKAGRALERVRARLFSDLSSGTRVLIGNPADEIARFAANGASSIVVMGLRGAGGLWRARRGSIAYRVLTRADSGAGAAAKTPRTPPVKELFTASLGPSPSETGSRWRDRRIVVGGRGSRAIAWQASLLTARACGDPRRSLHANPRVDDAAAAARRQGDHRVEIEFRHLRYVIGEARET